MLNKNNADGLSIFSEIRVHPRIARKHPEISNQDVEAVIRSPIAMRRRNFELPSHFVLAGVDTRGRLLQVVGALQEDGTFLAYHSLKLTRAVAVELELWDGGN
ncbi:MAG: hypothetical protein FWE46_04715 [Coriobacteriia bacterium]|nr:hypothetical protein [Coriobacteriia bacterium]MCL2537620.1 hypothetical protein [Coriobacteriia bacterium]